MNIPLPKDTENIIRQNVSSIGNLALIITKYIDGWGDNWEFEGEDIGKYLKVVSKRSFEYPEYTSFLKRRESFLDTIESTKIKGKTLWRLVVGLGSGSVLETSMTLHHLYGIPYIPGTALKGFVSSYYIEKNREDLTERTGKINTKRKEENKKEYDIDKVEKFAMNEVPQYIKLFGNENQKGKVTFLDAYPVKFPKLEMDVMTPHFGDYYSQKDSRGRLLPPADWMNPNPVTFITVAKDTEFIFAFKAEDDSLKEDVKSLIKEALQDFGIGAKTSVGYGYFKNLQETDVLTSSSFQPATQPKLPQEPPLPSYLKNETTLKDEFLNSDGMLKSEEEYKKFTESSGKTYNKKRRLEYEKASKWNKKNKETKT